MADASLLYHLDLESNLAPIEAWLNDIPVWRMDGRKQGFFSLAAHSFLCDGENTLELIVAPGQTPSTVRQPPTVAPPGEATASARLVAYKAGARLGEGGQFIAGVEWKASEQPPAKFPLSRGGHFPLGKMFGPWAWQSAAKLDLQRDGAAIQRALEEIYAAFRAGNSKRLLEYCDKYFSEEARAYPARSEIQMREMFARQVSVNTMPEVKVDDLNPAAWDLRLCAQGRLVECVDREWRPLLRAERPPKMGPFTLPIFLGKLKGEYQILR